MTKFTKLQRVTKRSEYQSLSKTANKFKSPFWIILYQPNQTGFARLGITVSKKCSKRAVDRNRIKRLVRESFRHHFNQLNALDIVVIARWSVKEMMNPELRENLETFWQKLEK